MKNPVLFIWGLALGFGPVFAQQGPMTNVSLQAVSLSTPPSETIYVFDGEEMRPLRVTMTHFHSGIPYAGPKLLTLFAEAEDVPEGELPYRPLTQIELPETGDNVVLLLNTQNDRIRGTAIPLNPERFPMGAFMLLNLSGRDVLMSFGEDPFRIPVGGSRITRPNVQERGVIPMAYGFADDEDHKSFVNGSRLYHPERRYFIFIYNRDGRVGMRNVTWFPARNRR